MRPLYKTKSKAGALAAIAFSTLLILPHARAGAVSVNGTCEVGNCTTPDTTAIGHTEITNFNFVYTFGNGDQYLIVGSSTATNPTGVPDFAAPFNVVYLGDGHGGPSGSDTLTIDVLQNEQWNAGPGLENFNFALTFGGTFGAGSSASLFGESGGYTTSTFGPYLAPTDVEPSTSIDEGSVVGTYLDEESRTYLFAAGSMPGADIANGSANLLTPEPGTWALMGTGFACLVLRLRKGRRDADYSR